MSTITETSFPAVEYPCSDGKPITDGTLQYIWIVTLKGNLDLLFRERVDVFVAGDHLIYPVAGDNKIRQAPDVYVAFGRPKGHRGSYRLWDEGDVFPQVVLEVLSPGNRAGEMARKRVLYRKCGAEEYYIIDPDDNTVEGALRDGDTFREVPDMNGFRSPRLGIRFEVNAERVSVFHPDGRPFLSFVELGTLQHETAERAETAEHRAEEARQKAERLAARLRELGVDPDSL